MYTFAAITTDKAWAQALKVYQANADYYRVIGEPKPTLATVDYDSREIPTVVQDKAKHYWLIQDGQETIGVIDLIEGYPDKETIYVGLLEIMQRRQGHGTAVLKQLIAAFAGHGYKRLELATVHADKAAAAFWQAQGFTQLRSVDATLSAGNKQLVDVLTKDI